MPERLLERTPESEPEKRLNICQICQIECQKDFQKICKKECQTICQIECLTGMQDRNAAVGITRNKLFVRHFVSEIFVHEGFGSQGAASLQVLTHTIYGAHCGLILFEKATFRSQQPGSGREDPTTFFANSGLLAFHSLFYLRVARKPLHQQFPVG